MNGLDKNFVLSCNIRRNYFFFFLNVITRYRYQTKLNPSFSWWLSSFPVCAKKSGTTDADCTSAQKLWLFWFVSGRVAKKNNPRRITERIRSARLVYEFYISLLYDNQSIITFIIIFVYCTYAVNSVYVRRFRKMFRARYYPAYTQAGPPSDSSNDPGWTAGFFCIRSLRGLILILRSLIAKTCCRNLHIFFFKSTVFFFVLRSGSVRVAAELQSLKNREQRICTLDSSNFRGHIVEVRTVEPRRRDESGNNFVGIRFSRKIISYELVQFPVLALIFHLLVPYREEVINFGHSSAQF